MEFLTFCNNSGKNLSTRPLSLQSWKSHQPVPAWMWVSPVFSFSIVPSLPSVNCAVSIRSQCTRAPCGLTDVTALFDTTDVAKFGWNCSLLWAFMTLYLLLSSTEVSLQSCSNWTWSCRKQFRLSSYYSSCIAMYCQMLANPVQFRIYANDFRIAIHGLVLTGLGQVRRV